MYIYIYIYIYIYEESRKKNQNKPNKINSLYCKANIKRFGFNSLHQDFDIMKNVVQKMCIIYIYIYIYVCICVCVCVVCVCVNTYLSHDIKALMKVIKVGFT